MLRVLTLNIWNLNHWRERRGAIAACLSDLRPDIVGLQEVVRDETGRCQAAWLADAVGGYEVAFAPGMTVGNAALGNAVLSRFRIAVTEDRRLSGLAAPDEGRVCLRADLDTPKGLLSFFTTHLNWQFHHGHVREAQVREVAAFVASRPESPNPPLLVGDFNAEPESTEVRFLKGLTSLDGRSFYMQDAYEVARAPLPGFTWDNSNPYAAASREPDRRIDYVFVGWHADDGTGQVMSARVACDEPVKGTWPTDHFGVLAEIAFG